MSEFPGADIPLVTARLVLRRFRPDDAPALAAYRSDPAVARYQSWSAPVSLSEAAALVESCAAGAAARARWFQCALEATSSHVLIGDLGVRLHENRMQAEIGITVAAPHQGQGHGSEALLRVVDHLLEDRGLHKLSAECDARNAASAALLRRVGFVQEGRLRSHTLIKGERTDDLLFGLLARPRLFTDDRIS
jgi:RimJ/RimL family protein N-acetyltransferase